jgi:hypothetical protein
VFGPLPRFHRMLVRIAAVLAGLVAGLWVMEAAAVVPLGH